MRKRASWETKCARRANRESSNLQAVLARRVRAKRGTTTGSGAIGNHDQTRKQGGGLRFRLRSPSYGGQVANPPYGPHPEETAKRASRRMAAGDSRAFMVRDGACAPPHHEGREPYSAAICRGAGGGVARSAASWA